MANNILIITIFILLGTLIFFSGWIAGGLYRSSGEYSNGRNGKQESAENREQEETKPKDGVASENPADKKQNGKEKSDIRYSVEVGSFVLKEKAVKMTDKLKEKGYDAVVLKMRDYRGKPWYLVQIGDFDDRGAAAKLADDYEKYEGVIPIVNPTYANLLAERKESAASD